MKSDASPPLQPPSSETIVSAKKRLRAQGRAIRVALSETERASASAGICERLRLMRHASPLATVAVYLATPGEANLDRFILWLLEQNLTVLAPRDQDFAPLESLQSVRTGLWGVREPKLSSSRPPLHSVPELILVPGLLFDLRGGRLGFGGGWYDRALARFPQARKIGVAFNEQIVDNVPREPHDVLMDAVVTPGNVWMRK